MTRGTCEGRKSAHPEFWVRYTSPESRSLVPMRHPWEALIPPPEGNLRGRSNINECADRTGFGRHWNVNTPEVRIRVQVGVGGAVLVGTVPKGFKGRFQVVSNSYAVKEARRPHTHHNKPYKRRPQEFR